MRYVLACHRQRLERMALDTIERIMPNRLLNTLAIRRIAFVTSSDARLGNVEVPSITITQIIHAVQRNEGRG